MFDFFFKKKKVILDCFTHQRHVYDYAKIDYGNRFLPDWWKNEPVFGDLGKGDKKILDVVGMPGYSFTIKHCKGLQDFYRYGIIIPAWFSAKIIIPKKTDIEPSLLTLISSNLEEEPSHGQQQFNGFATGTGYNYKLKNPWTIRCNKRVKFCWSQPSWSMRDIMFNLSVLPAVIDFASQHNASINFFYEVRDERRTFEIEPLQPLVALHPLTDYEIEIRHHYVENKSSLEGFKDFYRRFEYGESYPWNKHSEKFFKSLTNEEKLKLYKKGKVYRDKILDFKEKRDEEIEKYGK